MRNEDICRIAQALKEIPDHSLELKEYPGPNRESGRLARTLSVSADGKGRVSVYQVYPGIRLSLLCFLSEQAAFRHPASPAVLEVGHCRAGRVGWNMKNGTSVYLGSGDLSCHSAVCCADSVMTYPMKYYEGISVSMDLETLADCLPGVLSDTVIDIRKLREAYCKPQKSIFISSCPETEGIFLPLYDLPEALRLPYFQLEIQELLLFLGRYVPDQNTVTKYHSELTELNRQIHDQLTKDLSCRFTIEELSRQYLINTSSLKEVFKAVYGLPIASYMKEYRIREAMRLLRETDESISSIAARVGYETQGKFTKSFRDVAQVLPSEYRKQRRQASR